MKTPLFSVNGRLTRVSRFFVRLFTMAALLGSVLSVEAATYIRQNNATKLDLAAAWSAGGPPGSGDIAQWDAIVATAANCTNGTTLNVSLSWGGIACPTAPGGNVVIPASGTSVLTLGASGINWVSAVTARNLTIVCPVTAGASQPWSVGTGRVLTVQTGATTLGSNNLTFDGAGTAFINSIITGDGTISLNNAAGTLVLGGANTATFTGPITNSAGLLKVASAGGLGSTAAGTTIADGAALDINAAVGAEPVSVAGKGVGDNGALRNSSNTVAGILGGVVTLTGDTYVGVLGTTNLTLGGQVTGGYALTRVGTGIGKLYLGNTANDYTGGTAISNGVLVASNSTLPAGCLTINGAALAAFESQDASFVRALGTGDSQVNIPGGVSGFNGGAANSAINIGSGSALTWGSGGFSPVTFVLNSSLAPFPVDFQNNIDLGASVRKVQVESAGRAATMSGNLTGTGGGGLEKLGAGHLILSGNNSYDGVTKVTGGTLTFAGPDAIPGGIGASGGASALTLSGVLGLGDSDFLRGLGAGADQVQWGPANGGFAAVNADRAVNLGGASAGVTWNSGGFVSNTFALVLGSTFATHTVDFQNPIDLGSSARTVQADNGTAAVDALISGQITGAGGALTKGGVGTLRLTHAGNSYSGGTILGGGTLSFASGALGGSGPISQTVASGLQWFGENTEDLSSRLSVGTLVATIDSNTNNITFASTLGGTTGGLTKNGAGTLKLTATNKYAGATTVSGGTLQYGIDNALGLGVVTVNGAGAVLDMGSYTDAVGVVTLSAGSILGSGTLASSGAFTMSPAGAVTCSVALAGGTASTLIKTGAGTLTLSNPSSTFAGKTTISAASYVEIVTLANLGSSCSLGQPTIATNGTIALGVTTTAGGLRYIGAGDSISDRVINLNGTTGGATLDVTGTGNLTLTSALTASGAGSKVLTLMGTGPGVGTLPGTIVNNSAANKTGVSKFGFGTWVLGGTNTYTGVNTFNGGVLSVGFIADGGVACNIGQAATNAANLLLGGGTLRFTANAGSYSTDRSFTLTTATRSTIDVTNESAVLTLNGAAAVTNGGLIKDGAGTLVLAGTSFHSGATIVSNGTLKITGALAGLSPVSVDGGILSGNGGIAGAVTNNAGGVIAPGLNGTAGGALSAGRLTLNTGSAAAFEFTGATNDSIAVTNAAGLALSGGGVYLYPEGTTNSWSTEGTYNLIQYTGALAGNVTNLSVLNPVEGKTYMFGVSGGWLMVAIGTPAASNVWDGGSTPDGNWLTANNWASDVVPGANASLTFAGAVQTINTNNYPAGTRFDGLMFDATAGAFTLAGNALALAGDVQNNSANAQTIDLPMTLRWGTRTFAAASNSLAVSAAIDDGAETNGVIKTGPNTLTLSGANAFDGAVAIAEGAVTIRNNTGLGATNVGVTVADNTALQLQGGITVGAEPLNLSGSGLGNAGALRNIADSNTYAGLITLATPSLIESDAGTLVLDVPAGNAMVSTATNVTFGGAGDITVADPIALGAGTLTKNDGGTLVLSGANTFTGLTTINAGTLRYGNAGAIATGPVTINGGTLDIGTFVDTVGLVTMTNGVITATGAGSLATTGGYVFESGTVNTPLASAFGVTKITGGTVTLNRASSFTGVTRLEEGVLRATTAAGALGTAAASLMLGAGELQLANDTPLGYGRNTTVTNNTTVTSDRMSVGAGVVHTNGTLSIGAFTMNVGAGGYVTSGTGAVTFAGTTLTGNPTFNVTTNGSGADTLLTLGILADGAVARTVTKSGPGTLALSAAASSLVNGSLVQLAAGQLSLNAVGALGLLAVVDVADGAILNVSTGQTFGALSNTNSTMNSGSVSIGSGVTLTVGGTNNLDSVFSDVISGSGSLTKAARGTLTLSAANLYTGLTTITNGMLEVVNTTGSATGPGFVNVASSGVLSGDGTCSGVVSNKSGGTIAPGLSGTAGGILTVGGLSLVAGATNTFEFAAGPDTNDQVIVTNTDGLTISGGDVLLVEAGTTNAWSAVGVYTLAQFTGTLNGTPTALTVKNPAPNMTYTFDVVVGAPNRLVVNVQATKTWSGLSGSDGNWTTEENWIGGVPGATDIVIFAGTGGNWRTNNNNEIAAGTRFDGLLFNAGASAFTLAGNAVNLHGNLVNSSTNLQTVALAIALDEGTRTFNAASGTVAVLGAIGEANGAGGIIKAGPNALTLAGANTFSGGVMLNTGTLNLANAAALGTGALTINGGTLDNTSGAELTLAGDNAQNWNANYTFKGTTNLDLGAGAVALNSNVTLTTTANKLTVGGVIGGSGRLTRTGGGTVATLVLGQTNTFTGGFTQNGGATIVTKLANGTEASSIGASDASGTNFALGGGGLLVYAGGTASSDRDINLNTGTAFFEVFDPAATLTLSGNLNNMGGKLSLLGAGTLELTGTNAWIGAGKLEVGTPTYGRTLPGGNMLANGTVLGTEFLVYAGSLGGTGTVAMTGLIKVGGSTIKPGINGQAGGTLTLNPGAGLEFPNSASAAFEFNSFTNDMIDVGGNISFTTGKVWNIGLFEEGTTNAWSTTGVYTLVKYTGTMVGRSSTNLTIAHPAANRNYFFDVVPGTPNRLVVTIQHMSSWSGASAVDANWTTDANWNGGAPVTNELVVFAGNGGNWLTNNNDFVAGSRFDGLVFYPGAAAFRLGGNLVNLHGNVFNTSSNLQTIALPLALDEGTRTIYATSGSVAVLGVVSEVNGAGGIIKAGANALTLAAANTFSGGLTLNAGTQNLNHASALGTGPLTINGGTLDNTSGANLALTGNNAQNWNAAFTFRGSMNLDLGTGAVALNSNVNLTTTANKVTVGGLISGPGRLTRTGSGYVPTLELGPTNTFTGGFTQTAGATILKSLANGGEPSSIGSSGSAAANFTISGGLLTYDGPTASSDRDINMTTASLIEILNPDTTLTLYGNQVNAAGGLFTMGRGTLELASTNFWIGACQVTGDYATWGRKTLGGGKVLANGNIRGSSIQVLLGGNTLGGTGSVTVSGKALIGAGTSIAPGLDGQAGGTLTINASPFQLSSNSTSIFEFNATTNDMILGTSSLATYPTANVRLYEEGTTNAWKVNGEYKLIQFNGTVTAGAPADLVVVNPAADASYTFYQADNWIMVRITGPGGPVWDGNGTNDNWTTMPNWNPDAALSDPFAGITFAGTKRLNNINDYAGLTNGGIFFADAPLAAGSFTLGGNAVTLLGGVANNSALPQTIELPLVLGVDNRSFTAAGNDLIVNGVISDGGNTNGINKLGANTLTLGGSNTYAGLTTIRVGALRAQNNSALGDAAFGTMVSSGAVLQLQGGVAIADEALNLNGPGVAFNGALRNMQDDNTYGGPITLGSSTRINSEAGTLTLNNAAPITNAFALSFGGGGTTLVSTPINTGIGTLTKDGSGVLVLSTPTAYSGLTTVSDGTLVYGCDDVFASGAITINGSNAVLDVGGFNDTVGLVTLSAGAITGSGTLNLTTGLTTTTSANDPAVYCSAVLTGPGFVLKGGGIGHVTYLTATNSTYTGSTHVQGGTLSVAFLADGDQPSAIGASSSAEGNVIVNSGVFEYAGPSVTINRNMTMSWKAKITGLMGHEGYTDHDEGIIRVSQPGTTLTLTGALNSNTGNVNITSLPISFCYKQGAGTLELAGANLLVGQTVADEGTLKVTGSIPATNGFWDSALSARYPLLVESNATLSGDGEIGPSVSVYEFGTIAPGRDNAAGASLTVGGLTFQANSAAAFEFNGDPTNDTIVLTGSDNLTLAPVKVYLYEDATTNAWSSNGVYNLIQYAGALREGDPASLYVANPVEGKSYTFTMSGGWVTLTIGDASVWDGGGADDNWSSAFNWSDDVTPVSGKSLTFAGALRITNANDFAANTPFGEIVFDATAEPFALGGNAVKLLGNVVNVSTNLQTIDLPIVLDVADRSFNTAANDIRVNGVISDGGNTLGIRKTGAYNLTLAGANTYGGETYISWGSVQLGASGSIPNGSGKGDLNVAVAGVTALDLAGYNETVNGVKGAGHILNSTNTATLTIGDNDAASTSTVQFVEYGGVLSLAKIGSGTQVLNGGIAIGGTVTVNAGTLEIGSANTGSAAFTVAGGSLRIANTNGSATGTGAVTVESGASLEGTGILNGSALTLAAGSAINPGVGGAGTLTVDDLAWSDGAVYNCDVTDLTGAAGEGYDGLVANGSVAPATAGNKLVIRLDSNGQTLSNAANATISLRVLTATAMGSLDTADYTLDTNDFLAEGPWVLTNISDSIYIYHAGVSQTNVWVGSGSWSTGANWSSGSVPAVGDVVVFDGTSSGDCSAGYNSVNAPMAGFTLDAGYTGTVTFAKRAVAGGMTLTVTGSLAVNSGILTLQGDTDVIGGGTVENPHGAGYTIQAANITVAPGASLNADNGGFASMSGPGKAVVPRTRGVATGGFGASHGGYGGVTPSFTNPTPRYGTAYGSTELGSGGSLSGGGALRLKAGTVTINGQLSASATGSITDGPGGSGGSIWIDGGILGGTGLIQANGMNTYHGTVGAGGGGGRIDLSSTTNNFAGGLEVLGGYGFYSTGTPTSRTLRRGLTGSITLPQSAGTGLRLDTFVPYTNLLFGNSLTFGTIQINSGVTVKVQAYEDQTVVTCGSLTVQSNGNFVCMGDYFAVNAANGGTPNNPYGEGVTIVASNITIEAGGSLNANNEGFTSGKYMPSTTGVGGIGSGPGGAGTYNVSGASYGGQSGGNSGTPTYSDVMKRAPMYGTVYGPTALGSAGNQHDFNGGGAIKLEVLDTITVDGVLSSDATHAPNTASSGGSLWISSGMLAGGGRISCNGGPGAAGVSAGGGGRLDISGTVNNFTGILQAQGGGSPTAFGRGQAGSVALPAFGGSSGAVLDAFTPYGTNFIFGNSVTFGDAVISNGVLLTLDANEGQNVFTFNSLTIQSGGVVRCLGNLLAVNAAGGGLTNDIRGAGVAIVVSNLTIEAGGSLNSDGRGFDSAVLPAARPVNAAGYGGLAGGGLGRSYGALSNVTALGCGNTMYGGGAIRITASGMVTVDGKLSCDGGVTNNSDGGSGGSLWIECNTLQGAGVLSASGSGATNKVGGGGGRIHLVYDAVGSPNLIENGGVVAFGGAAPAAYKGAAGTLFLVNRGSTESLGTLLVANDVPANNTVTPLPTNENLTVDRVYVKANGALQLPQGMTLGVTTVFSNSAVFAAGANSTVELVGTNDAVVLGSSTFEGLRIDSGAKTVRFEAGQTTTVRQALTLARAALRSTEDGVQWFITCAADAGQNVRMVSVKDSNAGGGATIVARSASVDLGNNVNWQFPGTGVLIILR